MQKEQPNDWMFQLVEDFRNHQVVLPDTPDHILLILKGHLLVEQKINCLLEANLPNPDALRLRVDHGPKFIHKLSLLRALIPKPELAPELWGSIKKLNDLRNEFAHKLSPNDVKKKIDEFTADVYKAFGFNKNPNFMENVLKKDQRDRVQESILLIMHRLACLTKLE